MSLQSKQPLRFEINSLRRLGVRLLYRLRSSLSNNVS